MGWVEALMSKLYNPTQVYRILIPERWVRRQYQGDNDAPPARFMRPLFQAFAESHLDGPGLSAHATDMVLFMPFLHWDLQRRHEWRTKTMEALHPGTSLAPPTWTTDEQKDGSLLSSYLWDHHPRHLLHPRRSLYQYYHHAFQHYHRAIFTRDRDGDQVVSRFQRTKRVDSQMHVLTVVDQLWLSVLIGPSGQAYTVISCFPQTESRKTPDPEGVSDVLQQVNLHLLTDPFIDQVSL
ncbi:hypothetical protein QBC34DRAFT_143332 [Podospora aff. communis PSN243]|uniref:Uncharacterized protein n=1 Tax=Podospora aff. communis PSN243 TaxID=3040156 RepID=A0AAV9GFA4_9PEZI|nr:hypothetical protein QBC34DRAFT_143332 [Podospora aff. communis PSN243]